MLAGAAALISMATYLANPQTFVRFGILHLIAISMLILPFVRPLKEIAIILGVAIVIAGQWTVPANGFQPMAMLLGFPPIGFETVDYFPLLPWLGVILMGYGIGHFLYVRSTTWRKYLPDTAPSAVTWPGRHSLLIYLLHQPVILCVLWFTL